MQILQLVHQYAPQHTGGTELYTQWLSHELSERGHHVSVFYRRDADGEGLERRIDDGTTVWAAWSGSTRAVRRFLASFSDPSIGRSFSKVLVKTHPDVVHVQHAMGLPLSIFRELRQRQVPYVITLHDFWWVCANAQLLTNYSHKLCHGPRAYLNCARCALARIERQQLIPAIPLFAFPFAWRNRALRGVMSNASRLIAPAAFVKDWYVSHGVAEGKIVVERHGLELSSVARKPNQPVKRPYRVGYLGGLSWQKGVHTLVSAFAELDGDIELWIAGDLKPEPEYVSHLRRLADPRVKFLDKIGREAVWQMLAQVDVIAVTSLWYETHCFVISEAFAAGVPVIASDLGVLSERIKDGVNGILVPPGDVAALREALARTKRHPELIDQLRSGIPPQRTVQQHMGAIEAVYEKVLRSSEVTE